MDFKRLESAFGEIPILNAKDILTEEDIPEAKVRMPIREAYFSSHKRIPYRAGSGENLRKGGGIMSAVNSYSCSRRGNNRGYYENSEKV